MLLRKITRNRIRGGRVRECAEECGIEDRNMRYVELSPRRLDTRTRQVGRKGIEEARRLLAEMQPPEPIKLGRELSRAS